MAKQKSNSPKKPNPKPAKQGLTESSAKPAKAATAKKPLDSKQAGKTLADLEGKIVKTLQQHAKIAGQLSVSDAKASEKLVKQLRDEGHASKLNKKNGGPLESTTIAAILRELASGIENSVEETSLRVAFLGPLHSYSHLATLERFGQSVVLLPVRTIAAVFEAVCSGQADAGVVPIENSTDGRIVDTLERLTKASVKICGEVPFPIHHNLLGIGTREDVKEVCSKPQAISQCRDWLSNHLPQAKVTPMSSTTAAAELAAKDKTVAAIASHAAGVEYGLKVLAKNIEDNQDNVTRFAVIGQDVAARTGKDKTSLMFELSHSPGALADAMVIFKRKSLNLTWIESFPKPGSPNEYLFFVELVGHQTDLKVRKAMAALEKKTVRLEVLGSYAQATATN